MEQNEKITGLNEKLLKTNEKIEQAKERLALLQSEKQKIDYERMQCIIGAYLPVIEEIGLSPEELKEFISGSTGETTTTDYTNVYSNSEVEDEE